MYQVEVRLCPSGNVRSWHCDREHKSKQSVRRIADDFLKPFDDGTHTTTSSLTVCEFVESSYLPYVEELKNPSRFDGYRKMWKRYLKSREQIYRCATSEHLIAIV
jgi:hypothetical protein